MSYRKFALCIVVGLSVSCSITKNIVTPEKEYILVFNKMTVISAIENAKVLRKKITPDFEKYDFSRLDKKQKAFELWMIDRDKNMDSLKKIWIYQSAPGPNSKISQTSYSEYNDSGTLIRYTEKFNDQITDVQHLDLFFTLEKDYHNGNIKYKGVGSWVGFNIGKSYDYDETGKLKKVTDYDTGYIFNYDQVFQFCDKHGISLKKRAYYPFFTITKLKSWGRPCWRIMSPDLEHQMYNIFLINAKNGKVLRYSTEQITYGIE